MDRQLTISDYVEAPGALYHPLRSSFWLRNDDTVLRESTSKLDGLKAIAEAFGAVTVEHRIDKQPPIVVDGTDDISIKNAAFVGIETEAGDEIWVSLKGARVIKKAASDFSALDEYMALLAFSKKIVKEKRGRE